jgi:hypothetical protein
MRNDEKLLVALTDLLRTLSTLLLSPYNNFGNNNKIIIINDNARFPRPHLLLKIPMGTRKNFSGNHQQSVLEIYTA